MIAFLKGHIEQKNSDSVLLDVQGVGYKVEVSSQTLDQLSSSGSEIKLLIYHHITESDQRLFGFFTKNEKGLFEKLITVKGVGPKLGLTILSGLPASNLISAITQSDVTALSRVPGIGKKTAERIILELKEKLSELKSESVRSSNDTGKGEMNEAIQALQALGFKSREAEQAVMKVLNETKEVETSALIRKSLALLNR